MLQTQATAEGENASKRKQTRANVDKTQTNAYTPLYCGFLHPPLQSPYDSREWFARIVLRIARATET